VQDIHFLKQALPLLPAFALALAGCDSQSPPSCLASVEPAVLVEVLDSTSGDPAAFGATGSLSEGPFLDSLTIPGLGLYPPESLAYMRGGDERPGTYSVALLKPGYQPWHQSGVRAKPGTCHVQTERLTARLQAVP
jgi:hypothetical protein